MTESTMVGEFAVIGIGMFGRNVALNLARAGQSVLAIDLDQEEVDRAAVELDALERQDSAVLSLLLGEEAGAAQLEASEEAFSQAVRRARANITLAAEAPVLDEIEDRYASFRAARDRLLSEARQRPLAAYRTETFPLFGAVKEKVFELLDLNHRAMVAADVRAQREARLSALGYGLMVLIALLSLAALSQVLLAELGVPAAVVSPSGNVVASTLPVAKTEALENSVRFLIERNPDDVKLGSAVEIESLGLSCRPLQTDAGRAIGWLVAEAGGG